ncbi:MAG: AprI/Inh family metalloprotease inhibitor [Rhizobiales bacterium]|nr:AprI/Inh family metalloprotease inhibitor [Hyphomicrobiales bacterium]
MAGTWELSTADREKNCIAHLKSDSVPGGAKLELDVACTTVFPALKEAAQWSIADEVLRLLDSKGKPLLTLTEVESGIYEGERPGEGLYFLQNIAAVGQAERKPNQLIGDWTFVREGKAICVVTLAMTKASDDKFALKVKPGCDGIAAGFGLAAWRMDRGELVLISARAEEWRFEETEPLSWQRIPNNVDAVQLVRK